jgi:uncharacterized membrane protein
VHLAGMDLHSKWLVWSIGLYLLAGACWLPVVWLQIRMRDIAADAAKRDVELPPVYWSYLKSLLVERGPADRHQMMDCVAMVVKPA